MPKRKADKNLTDLEKEQRRRMKAYEQMILNNQYKKEHYERITLLVRKGEKQGLVDAARAEGKSLSSYILSFLPKKEEEE
ncbi:MAG: hypothetical protein IKS18_05565 [Lachnospiraceae bacterium]|nr:hypothetical protein [Lachnospiraceae bacterium]